MEQHWACTNLCLLRKIQPIQVITDLQGLQKHSVMISYSVKLCFCISRDPNVQKLIPPAPQCLRWPPVEAGRKAWHPRHTPEPDASRVYDIRGETEKAVGWAVVWTFREDSIVWGSFGRCGACLPHLQPSRCRKIFWKNEKSEENCTGSWLPTTKLNWTNDYKPVQLMQDQGCVLRFLCRQVCLSAPWEDPKTVLHAKKPYKSTFFPNLMAVLVMESLKCWDTLSDSSEGYTNHSNRNQQVSWG